MNPFKAINWMAKSNELEALLELAAPLTVTPLVPGLEAEVTRIDTAESSYVLKTWNKSSKPDVQYQYRLLEAMFNAGLSVSKPIGWGVDPNQHQVLLTSYDGTPVQKVNPAQLANLAQALTRIHQLSLKELEQVTLQEYDFVRYFYPAIDENPDIKHILLPLVDKAKLQRDSLIHGDYNLGNILEDDGKLTIIDWTNGQLGDARYDRAWSILILKIYAGVRHASVYQAAFLALSPFTKEESELFEAIACLRWVLLSRRFDLSKGAATVSRVKNILKNNGHLDENLLGKSNHE